MRHCGRKGVISGSRTDACENWRLEPGTVPLDDDGLATLRDALITEVAHCAPLWHDGQHWQHSAEHWTKMLHAERGDSTGVNFMGLNSVPLRARAKSSSLIKWPSCFGTSHQV